MASQSQSTCLAAQPGAQFIQLQMRELEMAKEAFVQRLCMFSSASQPGGDGRLSVAEDPFGSRRVQPFGQRRQHYSDLVRGGFQTVQGSVAPGSERGMARLAAKGVKRIIKLPVEPIKIAAFDSSLRCALARCGTQSAT